MGPNVDARIQRKRRRDRWTAERLDLAALTARAFDLRAARSYLRLSGVKTELIDSFAERYPARLRATEAGPGLDRRRRP